MARQRRAQRSRISAATGRRHDAPRLAKLTRPQLSGAIPRLRLFRLLDEAKAKPLIWIHGPPGAGKTTLVASYLATNRISGIWYQIDCDDADLASFFYYLGLAAPCNHQHQRQAMPLLIPEYLPDIEGFTRRFFRELCAQLGDTDALVFDNYQEVPASQLFHRVIAWGLSEVPSGTQGIIVSRTEPPAAYARLVANSLIAQVGWDDLRLTLDETSLIATARQPVDAELLQTLHEQSGGWAAGLVLMLERLKRTGAVGRTGPPETLETVFNYFAGEIFEELGESTRDFLTLTSMVPRVTGELANALTGRSDAASVLATLHKQQLFVDRQVGDTLTYQYHALFRLFLQAQAKKCRSETEWKALVVASAEALATHGQVEEAVPLFVSGGDWEAAIRMIMTHASPLLALGRWQTVQQWIQSLPEPIRNTTPWLGFWSGMCRLRVDPAQARLDLEPAFVMFRQADDMLGQALAATAMIETYAAEWIDYSQFDPWIAELETLLTRGELVFPSADTELVVNASLFHAISLRQSYREGLPEIAKRLLAMLRRGLDPNNKLFAARALIFYGAYSGEFALSEEVASYAAAALNASGATALNRAWYLARRAFGLRYAKSPDQVRTLFHEARALIRSNGLGFMEVPIATLWAWCEDVFDDPLGMQRELGIVQEHLNPASRFEMAFSHVGIAFLSVRNHDLDAAILHLQEAIAFFRQSGSTIAQAMALHALSAVLSDQGRLEEARAVLAQALPLMMRGKLTDYICPMLQAGLAHRCKHESTAIEQLQQTLPLAAKCGFETVLSESLYSRTVAELCAVALKHGIETEFVKRIIHCQRLNPPSVEIEQWPWPVRIYLLGRFRVYIDDQPLVFAGKGPKKPLELLKTLVAAGGMLVDVGRLAEQLWPDADAVRDAFNVTHARLRKLLPVKNAVVLDEGKLSLNAALVWTDIGAFERAADQCSRKLQHSPSPEEMAGMSETLLSLYGGELLKGEMDAPWLITARDRVKSKFLRTLKMLGAYWEGLEAWDQAQRLYERVIEIDNVAEEIYRRLMRCHAKAGHAAEALRVYRRCHQMLSLVLGIAPSVETETLFRAIRPPQA